MAHQRKLIRAAVVSQLRGATAAADRVRPTFEPIRNTKLPAISVYTPSEETDPADSTTAPRELWRELELVVVGWVVDTAAVPVADAMDDLAEQIEAAMAVDRYFGGLAGDSILTTTEMATLGDQGADPLVGLIKLTYAVTYRTDLAAAANLADFLRAKATYQVVGGVPDTVPVSDGPFTLEPP